jgi:hypothetical protein
MLAVTAARDALHPHKAIYAEMRAKRQKLRGTRWACDDREEGLERMMV